MSPFPAHTTEVPEVDENLAHALTHPRGFYAAATYCGIKKHPKRDLGVLASALPCQAAWSTTRNQVVAAPIVVSREHLNQSAQAIYALVLNSGNANAVTGPQGLDDARTMCALTASALSAAAAQDSTHPLRSSPKLSPEQVVVMSTGVIGQPMPMHRVEEGLPEVCRTVNPSTGGSAFTEAMMTTDTCPKHGLVQGRGWSMGGAAKGSGMIHPNMATMLGVITTDACVSQATLQHLLSQAVRQSFNRISVDGDTSTNDMVLVLANGASGVTPSDAELGHALTSLCIALAKMIVRDGEGATKFVTLTVSGASSEADAELFARTIATSPLVKTSWFGQDANWGRILAAAGRAGPELDTQAVSLSINGLELVRGGTPLPVSDADGNRALAPKDISIELVVGKGLGTVTYWTCDLSHDYVKINGSYRS